MAAELKRGASALLAPRGPASPAGVVRRCWPLDNIQPRELLRQHGKYHGKRRGKDVTAWELQARRLPL